MKKLIYPLIMILCLFSACANNDNEIEEAETTEATLMADTTETSEETEETEETEATEVAEATCEDAIKNQDEEGVDCGGVCAPCETASVLLEEGDYHGFWNSTATNGSVYTNLKVTARITKVSDTEYTGALFISDNFVNCCSAPSSSGDGPITITIVEGKITFKWIDEIPGCEGVFNGTGTYSENNKLLFDNLTGNDCEGDHTGTIEFFK